jgi:hypothetical protein
LRARPVHERGKVELKLVTLAPRIRALHFAELALETLVDDAPRLARVHLADIAVVLLVE